MAFIKNELIQLEIENISNDGNGVGHYESMAVFVPFCVVGDILQVKIVKPCKTYAFGIIEKIIQPGEGRVEYDCPNYSKCGGCNFRHMTYQKELESKQQFVGDALKRIGKIDVEPLEILASPQQDRYRNKVQYPLTKNSQDDIIAGFYAGRSHTIIPCSDCLLQPENFTKIIQDTCKILKELHISTYNEEVNKGIVRHIYLRDGVNSGEVLLCLVINANSLKYQDRFVQSITALHPNIKSIIININKKETNVVTGQKCVTIFGKDSITDTICDVPVNLNPLSFYQVNTKGANQLYSVAKEFAQVKPTDVILDIYCGMGTIGLSMAKDCAQIIGVEIIPQAIESANVSAKTMGIHNARFIASDASKSIATLAEEGLAPNIIILDPPRKGCENETLDAVIKMNAERIVMISCNPATAARDVKYLSENNYDIVKIQPVDMFPRTKHVETVIALSRTESK